MRLLAIAALFAFAVFSTAHAETTLRVLFVGNSLTYYNDLPSLTAALVHADNPRTAVETDMLADGGATMRDHLSDGALARALDGTRFDVVVLQDRGGYPMCSHDDAACADSVASMCEATKRVIAAHARAIWYGTWQMIPAAQTALSDEGRRAAQRCGTEFADVGAAMRRARDRGLANLWLADGHPTIEGSWVAAATLARVMKTNRLSPHVHGLAPCRKHWSASLTRRELASRQAVSEQDCDAVDANVISIAIATANEAAHP